MVKHTRLWTWRPRFESGRGYSSQLLTERVLQLNVSFVADEMLGKLAKWLRIIGICVFTNETEDNFDDEALKLAKKTGAVLLTRDESLYRRAVKRGFKAEFVPEDLDEALIYLSRKYGIDLRVDLSRTRCPLCNAPLRMVNAREVNPQDIPEQVLRSHEFVLVCDRCGKFYWTGRHYRSMLTRLKRLRELVNSSVDP